MFSATVGIEIDRFIRKYGRISPTKALFFQAIGSERVEALADKFNEEIREEARAKGFTTHPRYSPGYGDLALDIQKEIFEVLDCTKQIGITLSESLLMSPSKSITAIIGLKKITSE